MKSVLLLLTLIALTRAATLTSPKKDNKLRYDDFAVFKLTLKNEKQRVLIENLLQNRENFNMWHDTEKEMHLMISPKELYYFQNLTSAMNIGVEMLIPNVQSLIDNESAPNALADDVEFTWTRYYTLSEIEAWLDGILAAYPGITEGFTVGTSYQGRVIRGIKISYKAGNPGIFIESNIHAREWITSATATWFINQLLTSTVPAVRQLAEDHDWYIVPVLNVDGFAYTHETDRMWRKTRQPVETSACIGADPNRNFNSRWLQGGSSTNPCAEDYAGQYALSEPEIKAFSDFVLSIKDKLNIMLCLHSYGQYVLSPYGHATNEFPENNDDLLQVGKAFADAVQSLQYKTEYIYGPSASTLYVTTGATVDWAYNEADIKLSYTIEFRDQSRFGFILPPVQIIPNCEEALTGILAMVSEAKDLGYLELKYVP